MGLHRDKPHASLSGTGLQTRGLRIGKMPAMPQSLTNLLVHLVFSTLERQPFLSEPRLREEMHRYLGGIVKEQGGHSLEVGGIADHVHLLVAIRQTTTIADLVRDLKRSSSIWIKRRDGSLKGFAWQGGYGAFSVGQTEVEVVRAYIQNQEEHHQRPSFQEEYRAFLEKYKIPYDERYVWE